MIFPSVLTNFNYAITLPLASYTNPYMYKVWQFVFFQKKHTKIFAIVVV